MKDKYKEFVSGFFWGLLTVLWILSYYETGTILYIVTAFFTSIATVVKLHELVNGKNEDTETNE